MTDEPKPTLDDIFNALAGWEAVEQKLLEWRDRSSNQSSLLDETFLLRALGHPEASFRVLAAQAGQWCTEVMARAIVDDHCEVRRVASRSVATPPKALEDAAVDHDIEVRRGVAGNRCTPAATLHHMAAAPFSGMWSELVQNPATGADTLDLAPAGPRPELHRQLSTHLNASDDLCRRLARHYLDEPEAPLRIVGLKLMFRGQVKVSAWGEGHTDQPPKFQRPSDVVQWLADGADLSTVIDFAHSASCPAWLRQFILSRVPKRQSSRTLEFGRA